MSATFQEELSEELLLCLAHTPQDLREALRIFFELDMRLGRIVGGTTEPMLGQMRLAWWRETLNQPQAERPRGDKVMDGIGLHWQKREAVLVGLVDAWEHVLGEAALTEENSRAFLRGRSEALVRVFQKVSVENSDKTALGEPAWNWAVADFASKVLSPKEREMLVEIGLSHSKDEAQRVGKGARGLAVLGALGLRSLSKGARPLLEGRGASLVAMRAAIFGR